MLRTFATIYDRTIKDILVREEMLVLEFWEGIKEDPVKPDYKKRKHNLDARGVLIH